MNSELRAFFERVRPAIDETLNELLPSETASPDRIHQAMRYSTLNGGKRIRPCLCVAAFAGYREEWKPMLCVASSVEMIHSCSPIHDDLPAQDADDSRRDQPSRPKASAGAVAMLADDPLQTLPFAVLGHSND